MKTFYTRSLSAVVFVIIMLGGILWSTASFYILFLVIAIGAMLEYTLLIEKIDPEYQLISSWHRPCLLLLVVAVFFLLSDDHFEFLHLPGQFIGFWFGMLLVIIIFVSEGLFMEQFNKRSLWQSMLGLLYIALPLGLMVNLRLNYSRDNFPVIPLGIICCIWINDTMAYIVGSLIGEKKFFPAISPKKTWEGTLGGIILTIIAGALYGYFGHTYTLIDWVAIAAITAIFGTAGDLLESKIKRLAGVKDSGNLMPGHGGFLDRFDSLLLAIPFVWLYAAFFL